MQLGATARKPLGEDVAASLREGVWQPLLTRLLGRCGVQKKKRGPKIEPVLMHAENGEMPKIAMFY